MQYEMATLLMIVVLTCLLSPMVLMEEVNPVMLKQGERLRQRTKKLEDSMKELTERMKEQDERMKEQDERMEEQDERMKEQEETIKKQEETIKALKECKACSKIQELNKTLSELQEKINPEPADYWMNSAILANNEFYQSRLYQFLTPAVGSNPRWVLCYRASTHGWASSTFHSRCDGKRDTVTIIKKGQYVFGGYTDIPWENSLSYLSTSNAFIFSLRNKEGLAPFKSMVTQPQYAIYGWSDSGPIFGGGQGHDIKIADNANSNTNSLANFGQFYSVPSGVQSSSTILAGTKNFTPDDWEVFYLG
ncbi:hypothetical protein ACROYT_G001202 [Oculina patagonica]